MPASYSIGFEVRSYRSKWWIRIFTLFFLSFSLAGLEAFWGDWLSGARPPNTTGIVVPAMLVLVGGIMAVHYFTTVVTLFPDAIEVRTLLSRKRMSFSEIRGRREYETTDSDGMKTRYIKLEPVDYRRPALEFQKVYNFDGAFYQWLNQLPNLGR